MSAEWFDQLTRALATGVSRRSVLKAVGTALGFGVAGALGAKTAAASVTYCQCTYSCSTSGATLCEPHSCRPKIGVKGETCSLITHDCSFTTKTCI